MKCSTYISTFGKFCLDLKYKSIYSFMYNYLNLRIYFSLILFSVYMQNMRNFSRCIFLGMKTEILIAKVKL